MSAAQGITRAQLLMAGLALALPAGARAATSTTNTTGIPQEGDPGYDPLTPADREAVKFLIDLEELQLAVYRHAATVPLSAPVQRFAAQALVRERRHRAILLRLQRDRSVIANRPRIYAFNAGDDATFLTLASRVEEAVVQGYNGVIVLLDEAESLSPILAPIAVDEATHAGAVRVLQGQDPVLYSFDDPKTRNSIAPILGSPEG